MTHDIVGVGEAMLRLWVASGERLEDAPAFHVAVAGAEANVVMAAARMGASTAWLSALPDNALGRRAAREIASHGVDVSGVRWVSGKRMGTYFLELGTPPRPTSVVYDRAGSAAAAMDTSSIDWTVIEGARLVHITGITPALSTSCRDLSFDVVRRARDAETLVSVDVNYRRMLWEPDECREVVGALAAEADVVIMTTEDARDVFGRSGDVDEILDAIATETGAARVVITAGSHGAHWKAGSERGHRAGYADAAVVDRIGAGDAFAAGVLLGVLDDDLAAGVERGLAMAALKLGILGDQLTATRHEVDLLIAGHGREVAR